MQHTCVLLCVLKLLLALSTFTEINNFFYTSFHAHNKHSSVSQLFRTINLQHQYVCFLLKLLNTLFLMIIVKLKVFFSYITHTHTHKSYTQTYRDVYPHYCFCTITAVVLVDRLNRLLFAFVLYTRVTNT